MNDRSMRIHVLILSASLALAGCGRDAPSPPVSSAPVRNPLAVTAPASLAGMLRIEPVVVAELRESLRVPGRIEADEARVSRIGSPVTGRIMELDASVGEEVRRGQVLARLSSTELSSAQLGFLKAYSQRLLAERSAQRAQQLYDADVIGAAELQRRQGELQQADAEVNASRDQLKVLGMSSEAILNLAGTRNVNSQSTITSPFGGTVLERPVTQGQVVQPADNIYTIADLSRVWLVAEVPEQHSELVRVGEQIVAEVTALPGRSISGRLSFVAATLNPETRTVRVRLDLPNRDRQLKPAMLATVYVRGYPQSVPVVPASSVIRLDNKDHVFVQTGASEFLLRVVTLGAEADSRRRVLGGLKEGERIVSEGAFQLNIERERALTQ